MKDPNFNPNLKKVTEIPKITLRGKQTQSVTLDQGYEQNMQNQNSERGP